TALAAPSETSAQTAPRSTPDRKSTQEWSSRSSAARSPKDGGFVLCSQIRDGAPAGNSRAVGSIPHLHDVEATNHGLELSRHRIARFGDYSLKLLIRKGPEHAGLLGEVLVDAL